ncbi:MAG: uracil-DNA glycosylase [Betaproteobacteria bacterium]|nr:uracil-DNA glycosylase [Betaproteobacteria bacterium]
MRTRGELMRELGLGPEWVLRAGSPAAPAASDAADGTPPPAPDRETTREPAVGVAHGGQDGDAVRAARIRGMDWPELKADVAACTACALAARRRNTVFGVGDEQADWLFVGEGPGADEDARGEPFVGQAGRLLDSMLAAVDLARGHDVYIANIVKCRPPGNRNPEPAEAARCLPYLHRQIELIRPRLIVALGKVAVGNLLGIDDAISRLRGRLLDYRGTPVVVTYHPAYLLRNLPDKAKVWEDLCFARDTMRTLKETSGSDRRDQDA